MKKATRKNNAAGKNKKGEDRLAYVSAKGAAAGLLTTLLLMLAVAWGMASGAVSRNMTDDLIVCCVVAGTTLGGWLCAKKQDRGVVTAGLCASGMYLIPVLVASIFVQGSSSEEGITMKIIIAALLGGAFGGVLRLYKKTKKPKVRR